MSEAQTTETLKNRTADELVATSQVSVVMATLNGARFLERALSSVREQTVPPLEIIVVDDGSSDDSVAIAARMGAVVIAMAHGGVCSARNAGIIRANGTYVALMDQDDEWHPEKLERQIEAVRRFPDAVLVATDAELIDDRGTVTSASFMHAPTRGFDALRPASTEDGFLYFPDLDAQIHETGWFILPSATLIRRDALLRVGMFSEAITLNEDVACFLKLMVQTSSVIVDRPLTRWRIHETNTHRDHVGMLRGRLALTRDALGTPEIYPQAFVRRLQAELGQLLVSLAREEARLGKMKTARSYLLEAYRLQPDLKILMMLASSFAGRAAFELLAKLRRAVGRPFASDSGSGHHRV
ncbi:glycosyltransferase [Gemmatimonas sp.]|uniref:glycosyltransferase n=1 Tax=Gemmatimonas sp. TaxID=1962908 RepID=UPI003569276C